MTDEHSEETETNAAAPPHQYLSRDVELRAHALQLANNTLESPLGVVRRAKEYYGFLNGDVTIEATSNG
jgi:hypothetical protein